MTKDRLAAKIFVGFLATAGISGTAGFFIGKEAFREELQAKIAAAFAPTSPPAAVSAPAAPPAAPAVSNPSTPSVEAAPPPMKITLLEKEFEPIDTNIDRYQASINFTLKIQNMTGKAVRAFDGTVVFQDLLGNQVDTIKLAINDPVAAGATTSWEGSLNFNEFVDAQVRLRDADSQNLDLVFIPRRVLFADGSTRDYPSP